MAVLSAQISRTLFKVQAALCMEIVKLKQSNPKLRKKKNKQQWKHVVIAIH